MINGGTGVPSVIFRALLADLPAGGGHEAIQPVLMAVDHRIGLGLRQLPCRLTPLGFLRKGAHLANRPLTRSRGRALQRNQQRDFAM